MATFAEAEHARDAVTRRLRRRPEVTSVAIERTDGDDFGVVVGLRRASRRVAGIEDVEGVEGVPVRVVVEGPAHPLEADAG